MKRSGFNPYLPESVLLNFSLAKTEEKMEKNSNFPESNYFTIRLFTTSWELWTHVGQLTPKTELDSALSVHPY
ncbi:Uncharacterized protein TCM_021738 [Theobroma cacao]|uniref:Uncharacterized protein n=1 Tax=Theobroma cacao TaxID=3641 RepID=A0A061ESB3_THECC|nr:Uncharacterized protein TCM_021738 [Theobroma cacao]